MNFPHQPQPEGDPSKLRELLQWVMAIRGFNSAHRPATTAMLEDLDSIIAKIEAIIAAQPQPEPTSKGESLMERLQQQCSDWGTYWRASDAHGVQLTSDQAIELLRTALGVEVEISSSQQREPQEAAETLRTATSVAETLVRAGETQEDANRMAYEAVYGEAGKVEAVADEPVVTMFMMNGHAAYQRHLDLPEGAHKLYLRPSQQALGEDTKRLDWLQSRSMGGLPRVRLLIMERGSYIHMQGDLREAVDSVILATAGGSQ